MNRSSYTPIDDELLSAYIDGLVTDEEKARVEAAVAADPALAWELDTLRRTVELVRDLPAIPLPRSFALREEQVADVLARRRAHSAAPAVRPTRQASQPTGARDGLWQAMLNFFNSGNLVLRNAAAVAALFLVIVAAVAPSAPLATQTAVRPETEPIGTTPEAQALGEEPTVAALEAAPAAAAPQPAPVTEAAVASPPAPAEEAPAAVERSAVMRSAAADSPAAFAAKAPVTGEVESSIDTGPVSMLAVPAVVSPVGEAPAPLTGLDAASGAGEPEGAAEPSTAVETGAPSVESAATAAPVSDESATPVAEIASAPDVAPVQEEEIVAAETPVAPAPQALSASGWSIWRLIQAALGVLALLLAFLWLRSRPSASASGRTRA